MDYSLAIVGLLIGAAGLTMVALTGTPYGLFACIGSLISVFLAVFGPKRRG